MLTNVKVSLYNVQSNSCNTTCTYIHKCFYIDQLAVHNVSRKSVCLKWSKEKICKKICLQVNYSKEGKSFTWKYVMYIHCDKSVLVRSYSSPNFSEFGLTTERYGVSPNAGIYGPE